MIMMCRYLLVILCLCPALAQADIYKAVDADGHVTYSSSPIKGGKKITLEPLSTSLPTRPPASPDGFPRVNSETQRNRDDTRRKILQNELSSEEKLLAEATQNLQAGKETPEVYKGADGKTFRNVAKYDEKIKELNDQVEQHQKNIDALKTELSKLK
ncbi:MAG TPA: DUF4124 domain-containing protein [Gallionella sp.]|nr:DUF4124 domain-containing protein [Gallionella sp.]